MTADGVVIWKKNRMKHTKMLWIHGAVLDINPGQANVKNNFVYRAPWHGRLCIQAHPFGIPLVVCLLNTSLVFVCLGYLTRSNGLSPYEVLMRI